MYKDNSMDDIVLNYNNRRQKIIGGIVIAGLVAGGFALYKSAVAKAPGVREGIEAWDKDHIPKYNHSPTLEEMKQYK